MFYITLVLTSSVVQCFATESQFSKFFIKQCLTSNDKVSCFANRAAKTIERSMDSNVTIFDGIKLLRNEQKLGDESQARHYGVTRFTKTLENFLNTHRFSVDLTEDDHVEPRRGGGGLGGGGGGFGYNRKALMKEAKYVQYAFMVLLGIFGLTGPLVMKTLAIMAAKALIASKMALIIVGSIALKKIFEKDHGKTSVKVHTASSDDDHDRIFIPNKFSPQWLQSSYAKNT